VESYKFVTPIYKSGQRNDVGNYRRIAVLSAIPKLFELLVYRSMYENLRHLISVQQHFFIKGRLTVSNSVEYSSFVLNAVEDGCQEGIQKGPQLSPSKKKFGEH
jgi:hypothetical protein